MADIFHTFFGICGLSLLKYFEKNETTNAEFKTFRTVDPTYALPSELTTRLGLESQILPAVVDDE